jgi:EmrB/QacA subfamily drug resistance transporter
VAVAGAAVDVTAGGRPVDRTSRVYRLRWWTLLVLCLSLVIITLDNTILNVAIPTIQRELDASTSELQWMVDAYTLVFAGLLLTAGALGDRFGRRGALTFGLAIFGTASVFAALSDTAAQVIGARAVMGVGGAFIMPSTLSIITNVFPDEERGRAIGVWAGVSALGIAIGPVSGGLLLEHFSWSSIFWVNVPVVVLALAGGRAVVPTSKDPRQARLDPLGALLSISGLAALVYAIIEAPEVGWTASETIVWFATGAALLGAFALTEWRSDHPMLDVSFFRNPRFTAASVAITLVFFAMFGTTFLFTQYMQFVLGYSALQTGVRLLPMALTLMVFAPLSARWVERVGTKRVVATGLVIVSLGMLWQVGATQDSGYGRFVIGLVVMALGMANVMAPATESIMGSLPRAKAGVGSAVNDTTRQVGGALGVAVIGSALASIYGSQVRSAVPAGAPPEVAARVGDSVGAAMEAGAQIGGSTGAALVRAAQDAFVDGMHLGVAIGAAAAFVGAIIAARFLPARPRGVGGEQRAVAAGAVAESTFVAAEPAASPAAGS